mmetsp:Transcript_15863/g.28549  ORF Transcript_15863/g.28549 Transcript_15863/m.28549 type:complete len:84 (+) Transcript_15863:481-732(+)
MWSDVTGIILPAPSSVHFSIMTFILDRDRIGAKRIQGLSSPQSCVLNCWMHSATSETSLFDERPFLLLLPLPLEDAFCGSSDA